jgi:hypothetical protein
VIGTLYPKLVGEQLFQCGVRVTGITAAVGESVARGQGVLMVGTEHPHLVREKLFPRRDGAGRVTGPAAPEGKEISGSEGAGDLGLVVCLSFDFSLVGG